MQTHVGTGAAILDVNIKHFGEKKTIKYNFLFFDAMHRYVRNRRVLTTFLLCVKSFPIKPSSRSVNHRTER